MDPIDSNWFKCEPFWTEMYPFMFPETSFVRAAEDVTKIVALTEVSHGHVLDVACGPGRYAIPCARAGYIVTGVDSSRYLLDKARELASHEGESIEWIERDMRDFTRPGAFDLAMNVFTSFGYFDDERDNRRVLENIYTSLKPGGVFLFDHLGKEVLAARFQPTLSDSLPNGTTRVQRLSVIDGWSRVEGEWILIAGDRVSTFHVRHWLYSGREIHELLTSVGFVDVRLYGHLDGTPYDSHAQRLVAVARRGR